eukprot:TRINITY_DN45708_c0_g1_i1.p1 TRINITY_DN45708_c0_g1~~TRINITY_DN45708_c0_g1_i1.p1  ORF type:complete len:151 (+),score=34.31 TRINITY_DN45708_c0_g1_i1:267-719(+)
MRAVEAVGVRVGSVLGICYGEEDGLGWHTDKSGEAGGGDGWLLSTSFGATASFEYRSPSLQDGSVCCYPLQLRHGDALLMNAGVLQHRVAGVSPGSTDQGFVEAARGTQVRRLNLQLRPHCCDLQGADDALERASSRVESTGESKYLRQS